ncbi:MAG: AAA family ATPase [delta proteobacterium ML8_F1]|nr:MAG: AAA family ATPase [delta proteobacterium ML8_F1]
MKVIVEDQVMSVSKDITLEGLLKEIESADRPLIVAAKVNNRLKELIHPVREGDSVEWVDLSHTDGMRIYQRSLSFIFIRAVMELYQGTNVEVKHSLSQGLYCELTGEHHLKRRDLRDIEERMRGIIGEDEPFNQMLMSIAEAREAFEKYGMCSKLDLLKYRDKDFVKMYSLGWVKDYFYGYMVPSAGYIREFELKHYKPGILLRHPVPFSPHGVPPFREDAQLFKIHQEAEQWGGILNVGFVANLNDKILSGEAPELIKVAEALHEKKIARIADQISQEGKRVILIAGPSSSGKTSFANRLLIQLIVNGLKPITLSTDDYFVNREQTPLDEKGEYDFDTIKAVDTTLFNRDLKCILDGEKTPIPTFNFQTGQREYLGKFIEIDEDQPVIIEGIHALNDELTREVLIKDKFKIYVSALTHLNIDSHNRIPTTDVRMLRRIIRDHQFRGHDAARTLSMWPMVRKGEELYIFPFQENADAMFNSALVYEMAVLRKHALPLLEKIGPEEMIYSEARRLIRFLGYFVDIEDESLIPKTSILKEFIGGSSLF